MRVPAVLKSALAALFALGFTAQASATDKTIAIELNKAANTDAGCRLTFVVKNDTETLIEKVSYEIAAFDASAGGLGGCPYAPGAAGNLATDDLIYMLNGIGVETGVSLPKLSEASAFIAARLDHPLPSRYAQAVMANRNA